MPSDGDLEARIEQAFVRVSTASGRYGVQVGRFASPFGAYGRKHLTEADPFLRPPLGYDYRTVLSRTVVARDADFLLRWSGDPEFFRKPGVPPVWDVPYQWGAMALGAVGPLRLGVAAMNSAPSSGPASWAFDWDRLERPSWVVTARTRLSASVEVGASYDRGPWMEAPVAGTIQPEPGSPPGTEAPGWRDFDQEIVSVDVAFERGPMTFTAEAMLDRWALPNVADRATERVYSLMLQTDVAAGLSLAARAGYIDFRPLSDGLGAASPYPGGAVDWDRDVFRYEGSVGYRLARNLGVLVSAYQQRQEVETDGDTHFVGARLWWAF